MTDTRLIDRMKSPDGLSDFERGASTDPYQLADSRSVPVRRQERYPRVSSDLVSEFDAQRELLFREEMAEQGINDRVTYLLRNDRRRQLAGATAQDLFDFASADAAERVRTAIAALTARQLSPLVKFTVGDLFTADRNNADEIRALISEIRPVLLGLVDDADAGLLTDKVTYDAGSGLACEAGAAYTFPGVSSESQYCAMLLMEGCQAYPRMKEAGLLIHALIHEALHRLHGWGSPDTYEFEPEFDDLTREVALRNPDSYTVLIKRLSG